MVSDLETLSYLDAHFVFRWKAVLMQDASRSPLIVESDVQQLTVSAIAQDEDVFRTRRYDSSVGIPASLSTLAVNHSPHWYSI